MPPPAPSLGVGERAGPWGPTPSLPPPAARASPRGGGGTGGPRPGSPGRRERGAASPGKVTGVRRGPLSAGRGGGGREKLPQLWQFSLRGWGRRREECGGGGWGGGPLPCAWLAGSAVPGQLHGEGSRRAGHFLARSALFSEPLTFSGIPSHLSRLIACPHPASVHLSTSWSCFLNRGVGIRGPGGSPP